VHYAPALGDAFRRTYRQLLKWNDELPFVKFGLSADEAIVLSAELASPDLDADALGRTIARLVAVCDLLHDGSAAFLRPAAVPGVTAVPAPLRPSALLERFAQDITELESSAS